MANIEKLVPMIFGAEGGFVNNIHDGGGATNMGVTLATWKSQGYDKNGDGVIDVADLILLTHADVIAILRIYWNRWKADSINNQSIANILVDWVWGSGSWGIKMPQLALHVIADGVVGEGTLNAINNGDQQAVFTAIWNARKMFIEKICLEHPDQQVFYHGWINRLNTFKFVA